MSYEEHKISMETESLSSAKYESVTNVDDGGSIQVSIIPLYLEDPSSPREDYFVWAYNASIKNNSNNVIQIVERYITITDCSGKNTVVNATGIVGEQPILNSQERYEYTTGAYLHAPSGVISGFYKAVDTETNDSFIIQIPTFSLDSPHDISKLH